MMKVGTQQSRENGISEFWYDRLGRLAISRSAEQKLPAVTDTENPENRYSYTKYDGLGRIVETGEKLNAEQVTENNARDEGWLSTWLASGNNRQVTLTYYDEEPTDWLPSSLTGTLSNLRKRVAAMAILSTGSNPSANRQAATYYSYDISGNVKTLTQENAALAAREATYITGSTGLKQIKYEYDLVSGKVNKVLYQDGKWDQFYYQYIYDADNRITQVLSSRTNESSSSLWVTEANYSYYLHGPLARVEIGKNKVQGMDYAYTLQGWLKGVNGQFLDAGRDMSGDGLQSTAFANHARDALAFTLGYFDNDYMPIAGNVNAPAFKMQYTSPAYDETGVVRSNNVIGKKLFNGNISYATYAMANLDAGVTKGKLYVYDQLNRIRLSNFSSTALSTATSSWNNATNPMILREAFTYNADGNIQSLSRSGNANPYTMDNLNYYYDGGVNGSLTGKLNHVTDAVAAGNYPNDIDNQSQDNYTYDKTGNLIGDVSEGITRINWTVYGKIASITKSGNTMSYGYDAGSNRITKKTSSTREDYYVRDAQGNVLSLYSYDNSSFTWAEQDLYGSNRLGMLTPGLTIQSSAPLANANYNSTGDPITNGTEGERIYELTNHLGNVMVTISDRKTGVDENSVRW